MEDEEKLRIENRYTFMAVSVMCLTLVLCASVLGISSYKRAEFKYKEQQLRYDCKFIRKHVEE